ncbi:3-isopropylmalate dehydrogenase [Thermodesulfobium acidiphilum]|uniref:3-isopropylmalate dehydrogenase n=1 Tax=Thermodesulfobium acidiphilum TaxID=1794699 RepID=A0A2R4W122_THEAF|nr:3-isopropylmalate dehydrogenase [Thermodesulfobium acidiphilum]AWB10509.1 3-isopropylmalate dehydrogenase [Thermodesulfobium acidiphilum]
MYKVAFLPGDGIGQDLKEVVKVFRDKIEEKYGFSFELNELPIGGNAIDSFGDPLPPDVLKECKNSDAVFLIAVGGPKWDNNPPNLRPEAGLLKLRKSLNVFCNIRPIKLSKHLTHLSCLKCETVNKGLDIVILRELTEGLYFGEPRGIYTQPDGSKVAINTMSYSSTTIEKFAKIGFELAMSRKKNLTSVDKANVLENSRLWREVVENLSKSYPEIKLNHLYVDNAALQMIYDPNQFDVIITENLFGDILSDEAAALVGSLGLLPSASIGDNKPFLYEPVHGSAPSIAGKNIANPIATIFSIALMLRLSFERNDIALDLENAVEKVLETKVGTADLKMKNTIGTREFANEVLKNL